MSPRAFTTRTETQTRPQSRSTFDRGRLQQSANGTAALDTPVVGRQGRRVGFVCFTLARSRAAVSKKNKLKPWQKKQWCIPEVSSEFVARMEDVLDLYHEPYDPKRPKVCFDEKSKQLIAETRSPIRAAPGRVERYDFEYKRQGTANLFLFCEPQACWRHIEVTDRRTMVDCAQQLKWLVDERYPEADVIRLVGDQLNTHRIASLYQAFAPEEARRIARKLEFHHTPKHGSWLNLAEIELSVLEEQCLDRRIPDIETLKRETNAYEKQRNADKATIDWRFTAADARKKLQRLYPSIST